ncbi:hypothetical protein GLOIN_2v1883106, partial [Rhizophagus irregularis DAOM 181602=DAOM 197198]
MEDSNDYNKDIYKTNAFFSPYSETLDFLLLPFNDNFAINFLPVIEPDFNHNFTNIDSFSLETPSKLSINPSLELLSEPSLELSPEPSFEPSSEPSCETPFKLPFEEHFESLSEHIYQYNLTVGDYFDDWQSVDTFMHQYCLERGFGYQKSNRSEIARLRDTIKTNYEWHCNFSFPKMENQVKCTSLKDIHNHEVNPTQLPHIIARYRRIKELLLRDAINVLNTRLARETDSNSKKDSIWLKEIMITAHEWDLIQNLTKPSSATEIDEDVFDYDDIEDESDQQHVSTPVNTSGLLKDFMNAYINIGIFKILINRSQIHSDLNTTQDEDDEIKEFEPSSQDKNLVNIADELRQKKRVEANFEESEAESELVNFEDTEFIDPEDLQGVSLDDTIDVVDGKTIPERIVKWPNDAYYDFLELIVEGIAKWIVKRIWVDQGILTSSMLNEVQKQMNRFQVPVDLGQIPGKIDCGKGFSNFTADQWRNFFTIYATVSLWDHLSAEDRKILTHFVRICSILLIEVQYGRNKITPNLHLSLHLSECCHDFSPLYAFWCFSFERMNGILGSLPNSNRKIEPELMHRLMNDNQIRDIITSSAQMKGLELLENHPTVGSLSENDQFASDEMERFWLNSKNIQESTVTGCEAFPGEMLRPTSENVVLSQSMLDLMIDYYIATYE